MIDRRLVAGSIGCRWARPCSWPDRRARHSATHAGKLNGPHVKQLYLLGAGLRAVLSLLGTIAVRPTGPCSSYILSGA
jgi:hypothetical protein